MLAAVACFPAVASNLAAQGQEDWARALGGAEHRIHAADSIVSIRVPLELEADAAVDSAWLIDVAADGLREQRMFDAITVAADTAGPALTITLDLGALDQPDTLAVRVAVRDGQRIARLDLRLRRPAAALADPGTIRVRRVPGEEGETPLLLRETTGRSRVTGITLLSLPFTADGDRPTSLRVVLTDDAPRTVLAGGAVTLPYRVEGDLPVGATRGSVAIDAPQLATPLVVQFELLRQRALWTLGIAILLGLVVGWVVRTYLQQKREVAEARQQADGLLRRLREARRGRVDVSFREALDAQVRKIENALADGKAAGITDVVQKADSALDQAIADLQSRLDAQSERLQHLAGLAGRGWHLPQRIDAILADLRARTDAARRAIEQADAGAAAAALEAAHNEVLIGDLRQALADWRADVGEAYAALREGPHGLPRQVVEKLDPRIETLQAELDAIRPLPASAGVDTIVATLQAIDAHRLGARERLRPVPRWIRSVYDAVVAILQGAEGVSVGAASANAMRTLDERIAALEAAVRDAPELMDALRALSAPALRQAWEDATRTHAHENIDEDELDKFLDEHDYVAAAELVAKPADTALGGAGSPEAPVIKLEDNAGAITGRPRAAVAALGAARVRALERPTMIDVRRTSSFWEIGAPKLFQWLIFAIIITVTGILVFREDYTGTFADIVGTFLWGFSLDVTADAVVEQIKGIRSVG